MAIAFTFDLTWLWVLMGVGAFLTVVATFVYAMTTQPQHTRQRHPIPGPVRLAGSQESTGVRAAA